MTLIVAQLRQFIATADISRTDAAPARSILERLVRTDRFTVLVEALIAAPVFTKAFGSAFADDHAVAAIAPCRLLRGCLNMPLGHVFLTLAQVVAGLDDGAAWSIFAADIAADKTLAKVKLLTYLTRVLADPAVNQRYRDLAERLVDENPHALYPTSGYRFCDGHIESTPDHRTVEAVMTFSTFSTIKVVDNVLNPGNRTLADIYAPLGRCVCFIDQNVEAIYGDTLSDYFEHHSVPLETFTYRAMEVDKGIATVERMLGDLKRVGIARNEPVLIMGGGVLADTGGLTCALYGRNTPYVMLATSIVTGIDAGPSPRTCCDGFGYKNLLGAYHPPVVSLTDRFFFRSLHTGWLRHGVAEIIKMAVVKNHALFEDLEKARPRLVETRFGTTDCADDDPIQVLSQDILSGALKSYIEAEYDNLYETHQCRPHAYGHTWSPGFEIAAGLLHGHAVAIGMGFGAYLSLRVGWIAPDAFERIIRLIEGYGLSLWHDILRDRRVMAESHAKIIQKRGGNLVAPLPKGAIGACGYLNDLSEAELFAALVDYEAICVKRIRQGRGIDPLCSDVGLEDPSTVMQAKMVAAD